MALLNRTLGRAQAADRPALTLRVRPVLLLAGAAIVAISLLQLFLRSQAVTSNYVIQSLEQEKLERETEVRQLEAQVASLSSLERVQQEAKRLGLAQPAAERAVQVNVPWTGSDQDLLPTRFAPQEDAAVDGHNSAWWRDLLGHLPFN